MEGVNWYKKAAEKGNASAQINLASALRSGKGVKQDDVEALKWYRASAEQGNGYGQAMLGILYGAGVGGLIQDYVRSHMWLNVAVSRGIVDSQKQRDAVAAKMTLEQVNRAQQLARECIEKKFKNCD